MRAKADALFQRLNLTLVQLNSKTFRRTASVCIIPRRDTKFLEPRQIVDPIIMHDGCECVVPTVRQFVYVSFSILVYTRVV